MTRWQPVALRASSWALGPARSTRWRDRPSPGPATLERCNGLERAKSLGNCPEREYRLGSNPPQNPVGGEAIIGIEPRADPQAPWSPRGESVACLSEARVFSGTEKEIGDPSSGLMGLMGLIPLFSLPPFPLMKTPQKARTREERRGRSSPSSPPSPIRESYTSSSLYPSRALIASKPSRSVSSCRT